MRYQIKTQPQAIFVDPTQADMVLQNDGSSTIFVDSISGINANEAIAMPALSTMVWGSGKPLWAMAEKDSAYLRVTPNTHLLDASRSAFDNLIYHSNMGPPPATPLEPFFEPIEVSAYNTLFIKITINDGPNTGVIAYGSSCFIYWLNKSGQRIYAQAFEPGFIDEDGFRTCLITVPVRGAFFQFVQGVTGLSNGYNIQFDITGSSRIERDSMKYVSTDLTGSHCYNVTDKAIEPPYEGMFSINPLAQSDPDWSRVFLIDAIGNRLKLNVRINRIQTAGRIQFRHWGSSTILATMDLPVTSTADFLEGEVFLPVSGPIQLNFSAPVVTYSPLPYMTGVWLDYLNQ